jgi:hypothetical protein
MDQNVQLVLVATISSPVLMAIINTMMRRWEKRGELRDQQEARDAARAAAAASQTLIVGQQQAAEMLVTSQEKVATQLSQAAEATHTGLQNIKQQIGTTTLASEQKLLSMSIAQLAYMQELIDYKRVNKIEPSPEALAALEMVRAQIATLRASIDGLTREEAARQEELRKAAERQNENIFNGALRAVEGH